MTLFIRNIYLVLFLMLLLNIVLYSQNYYETLGNYGIELSCMVDKNSDFFTTYNCILKIYDIDKKLIMEDYRFRGNGYEIKKFNINKNSGEDVIFVLDINNGANTIWGKLSCIKLKDFKIGTSIITVPVIINYSDQMHLEMIAENEEPKLLDIIKDIDYDGILEIIERKYILMGSTGKITAGWVTLISHIESDKLVNVNSLFYNYLMKEIDELKIEAKQNKIKCNNQDDFAVNSYHNLLGSIVISHALLDKVDDGFDFFDLIYKCDDKDLLKKKILMYYNENFTNN